MLELYKRKQLMKMEIEKFYEFSYDELGLTDKDLDVLYEMGLQRIKSDKRRIIEYFINEIFTETMLEKPYEKKKIDFLKEKIKIILEK
jgi:hypothetical protein